MEKIERNMLSTITGFLRPCDTNSLVCASRGIKKELYKRGWLRFIRFEAGGDLSHCDYVRLCSRHKNTIKECHMVGFHDPWMWVALWVDNMKFIDCTGDTSNKWTRLPRQTRRARVRDRARRQPSESSAIKV